MTTWRQASPGRRAAWAALALLAAMSGLAGASAVEWRVARPDHAWSFPGDHWAHRDYRTEWWYFTGHLQDVSEPSRRFGFQFTIFRIGLLPAAPDLDSAWAAPGMLMGHAAISDLSGGEHRFAEVLHRETPFLARFGQQPDPVLAWSRAAPGTDGEWRLSWTGEGFAFAMADARRGMAMSLDTRPERARILQGPNGYSRKSEGTGAASLYYSYTRLATRGTVTLDGRTYTVSGRSWMDKEISSSQLSPGQVGWDWFSLQLDDGRDLMLYMLRDGEGGIDFARGTRVAPDGEPASLDPDAWRIRSLDTWISPETGIVYPSGWEIILADGETLRVEPELDAQENTSAQQGGLHYWEGAVRVETSRGQRLGQGYVELTGYGSGNRPPI